jgi:GNAT superfamily N-acetyltransferase
MTSEIKTTTLVRLAGDALIGLYRHAPGFDARLTRDTWLIASGELHPQLNWIAVFECGPAAEVTLRDHVAAMRARGLPALVFLTPTAGEAFAALCPAIGLVASQPAPLMICRLDKPIPTRPVDGIEIAAIRDSATFMAGIEVFATAFGMRVEVAARATPADVLTEPALTFFAAKRDADVVAVAATSRVGNLVYLDLMATSSAHRRRGIGYALLAHALAEHATTGATHAVLVSSDEGRQLYERLGFRVLFEATMWEVPPTLATGPRHHAPDP